MACTRRQGPVCARAALSVGIKQQERQAPARRVWRAPSRRRQERWSRLHVSLVSPGLIPELLHPFVQVALRECTVQLAQVHVRVVQLVDINVSYQFFKKNSLM
jgi:hypothetical protein